MNTISMAEKEQIARQNDWHISDNKDLLGEFKSKHGNGMLFKDGSSLEYTDEKQKETKVKTITRKMELNIIEDKEDGQFVLELINRTPGKRFIYNPIKDTIQSSSILPNGEPVIKDKKLVKKPTGGFTYYLEDLDLPEKTLESLMKKKNNIEETDELAIISFLKEKVNSMKEKKEEKKAIKRRKRRNPN